MGAGEPEVEAETVVAAVDLGSNSFHLLIGRASRGRVGIDEHIKEAVRVGADAAADGTLSEIAIQRGLACLERFGRRLAETRPGAVGAVGTNALRIAPNAADFLAAAERRLGCRVDTISGIEEARLIYLGVSEGITGDARRLVADIGGGSTELILGEGVRPLKLESLPVGCVGLTEHYFPDGALDAAAMHRAEIAARRELEPAAAEYRGLGWSEAIGASGTVHAIASITRSHGWGDGTITPSVLDRLTGALLAAGNLESVDLSGLADDQRPVLPGGVAIMRALFAGLGIKRMRMVDGALREGLLRETFARASGGDIRPDSARELAERAGVDMAHARRVQRIAQMLLDDAGASWSLDGVPEYENWLCWAAWLNECGKTIARSGYHRHGAYVVENADLAGWSHEDQRCVAALIRAHRRAFSSAAFEGCAESLRARLMHLALILRLAVLLCRSRADLGDAHVRLTASENAATLHFPAGWLGVRPLIEADLEEEAGYWREAGLTLEFE